MATPIGNLGDLSQRAIETFQSVNLIAAEDTRTTGKLLKHNEIKTQLTSYHEHNEIQKADELVARIKNGTDVALVSDAGTPGISDPGYRLVKAAHDANIQVTGIPGPSSITAALSISGLPTDHFYFEGFLPRKKGRLTRLKFLSSLPVTVVIFESPVRLLKTLEQLHTHFGDRVVSVCREMTKIHEEVFRGSIWKTINHFREKTSIKGEVVILIAKTGYEE